MKRLILLIACSQTVTSYAQNVAGQLPKGMMLPPVQHYQDEYQSDTCLNPAAWQSQQAMHVSFVSTDTHYFRNEVPAVSNMQTSVSATAWKGERVNTMLLVWSTDTLQQVRVNTGKLKDNKGVIVANAPVYARMVKYVVSNFPYGARNTDCDAGPGEYQYLMPDRLEPFDRFDLPGKSTRPVWITIDVPSAVAAGDYELPVSVQSTKETKELTIKLHIQNEVLPPPVQWKHRLDLWQNPSVIAAQYKVPLWSDAHKMLVKQHLAAYADLGGTFITTYAVHSPWSDNSYTLEDGMIDWVREKNGKWRFDYTHFDWYVQLAMSLGINRAITVYTPVPWGFRFRYLDAASGNYEYTVWPPESKEFATMMPVFLSSLQQHLEQKGWMSITYLGINENELQNTIAAIKVIKKHSPKWKITYAGDWHAALNDLLDDYCFVYGKEATPDTVKQRSARGKTTTFYVCCTPPVPNNFVFSPPVESRFLGWYSTAHHYDGFLRWAYDAWPDDVNRDARHSFWPAGDCFLVYPGGYKAMRTEKLREGIVDFEKLHILEQKVKQPGTTQAMQLWLELQAVLQQCLAEKEFESSQVSGLLQKGEQLIAALTDALQPVKK